MTSNLGFGAETFNKGQVQDEKVHCWLRKAPITGPAVEPKKPSGKSRLFGGLGGFRVFWRGFGRGFGGGVFGRL